MLRRFDCFLGGYCRASKYLSASSICIPPLPPPNANLSGGSTILRLHEEYITIIDTQAPEDGNIDIRITLKWRFPQNHDISRDSCTFIKNRRSLFTLVQCCANLCNVVPIYAHMRTCRSHILHLAVCLLNAREYYPPVYTQTRIRFHPHTNQDGKLTNSDHAVPIYLDSCTSTQRLVKCPYTKYRLRDMIKGSSYLYNVCQFQKNRK